MTKKSLFEKHSWIESTYANDAPLFNLEHFPATGQNVRPTKIGNSNKKLKPLGIISSGEKVEIDWCLYSDLIPTAKMPDLK